MLHRSQRQPARLRPAAFAWAGLLGLGMIIAGCSAGGSLATGASPLPLASAEATSSVSPPSATPRITGRTVAGPTCPVAKNPPDPACADRPVAGAVVIVRNGAGAEIARMTTAADGSFAIMVPGGGSYTVEAQPHKGFMRAPAATVVTLPDDAAASVEVTLTYDTGIR